MATNVTNARRRKRIIRSGIRAAQRFERKNGRVPTRQELLRLRVRTVAPWKRHIVILSGLAFVGFGLFGYWKWGSVAGLVIFGALGLLVVLMGAFSTRKQLDQMLRGIDASVSNSILDAIIDAL
ncbi:MAG TPA: hypothetical protein VJW76_14430 [Verrucomicrobiae bacterium]|nr:hypothetical protein [Verrucomicrobiae bacterium]